MEGQNSSASSRDSVLTGVHGFLLFFVLAIVVLEPAESVYTFAVNYRGSMSSIAESPHRYSLYGFYFVEHLLIFVTVAYGIFCGLQLWKIRVNAISHVKQFLLVILLFALADYLAFVMLMLLITPSTIWSITIPEVLLGQRGKSVLAATLYCTVWYAYFAKSKRVRLTYSLPTVDDEQLRSGRWLKLTE